jgi:hypothetical protein
MAEGGQEVASGEEGKRRTWCHKAWRVEEKGDWREEDLVGGVWVILIVPQPIVPGIQWGLVTIALACY